MNQREDNASKLPPRCPKCLGDVEIGYVHGGEDVVCWSRVHRNEVIEMPQKDVLFLQRQPRPKSFRLSSVDDPEPLRACRCAKCQLVVLYYDEALDWSEFKK